MFAYSLFASFEFYYEKRSFIAVATIISAVFNIFLNYHFINIFGYYAAGYTTLVCYMLYTVGHYIFMKKICRDYLDDMKVYDDKQLVILTISFLSVGFLMLLTYQQIVIRYIIITIMILLIVIFRKSIYKLFKSIMLTRGKR